MILLQSYSSCGLMKLQKSWQQILALIPIRLLLCRPQHFHAARKQNVNLLNVVLLYWWIMNSFCDAG